jgi:hypothetical protein
MSMPGINAGSAPSAMNLNGTVSGMSLNGRLGGNIGMGPVMFHPHSPQQTTTTSSALPPPAASGTDLFADLAGLL